MIRHQPVCVTTFLKSSGKAVLNPHRFRLYVNTFFLNVEDSSHGEQPSSWPDHEWNIKEWLEKYPFDIKI